MSKSVKLTRPQTRAIEGALLRRDLEIRAHGNVCKALLRRGFAEVRGALPEDALETSRSPTYHLTREAADELRSKLRDPTLLTALRPFPARKGGWGIEGLDPRKQTWHTVENGFATWREAFRKIRSHYDRRHP